MEKSQGITKSKFQKNKKNKKDKFVGHQIGYKR